MVVKANASSMDQTVTVSPPTKLPAKYKRLIGRKTGKDFRSVAEVEECDITEPGEGQVLIHNHLCVPAAFSLIRHYACHARH